MPEEILKALLITSVAGSGLALAITLIRPLTKKVLGYAWHYYIWLTVLLVMMLPVRFSIPSSEPVQIPGITTEQIQTVPTTEVVTEKTDNVEVAAPAVTQPSPVKQSAKFMAGIIENRINILGMIWLFGMLVVLSIGAIGYIKLLHKIHKHSVIIFCPEVQNYTKRRIKVRTCENLSSPFIMGIIRPTLVLPSIELTPEQLDNILKHETTHLKRNDVLYKWIVGIVKTIHWFNPLVYYISRQIDAECEISCDMAVVKNMNEEQEMGYVETILSLLAINKTKSIPLTTGMTGNKNMLKRRFTMIRNKRTTKKLASLLSVLLSVIMLGTTVFASGILSDMTEDDYRIDVTFNGTSIVLQNKPFVQNGHVYIPLRESFEKVGLMNDPESAILWDNGKIEIILVERIKVEEDMNKDYTIEYIIYNYGLEINDPKIVYNPNGYGSELNKNRPYKIKGNVPILKDGVTYIPYDTANDLISGYAFNGGNTKNQFGYKIFDKEENILGSSLEVVRENTEIKILENMQTTSIIYDETNPSYIVSNFFELFREGKIEEMKKFCTQACIDKFFDNGKVLDMEYAEMLTLRVIAEHNTSASMEVKISDLPAPGDRYSMDDMQTYTVYLTKQADNTYLINHFE